MYESAKFLAAGDSSVFMEFGNSISPEINAKIRNLVKRIETSSIKGIIELLPTYRSIQIMYNPLEIGYDELITSLRELESSLHEGDTEDYRIVEIPTLYGGKYGPDIEFVAEHNNISVEEVIRVHTSTDYLIYMLGFTPGFCYLGGMSDKIATPRLKTPRPLIPAGSVGIAGSQTGIYPIDSPGGWQLIGRTPLKIYDPSAELPIFLKAGDYLRFVSISEKEYFRIQKEVEAKDYKVNIIINGEVRRNE
ncbi:5-oxoprolinase subunit PxpB [Tissierella creatinini]|nr:5-oxoprolinase subunit PxpB [Tissierella creatinini]TJX63785.1 5-oxoprolinase subunit PxpB [Soehngenia saccharolytica]